MLIERIVVDMDRFIRQVIFFPIFRVLHRTIKANHLLLLAFWCPMGCILHGAAIWANYGFLQSPRYEEGWHYGFDLVVQGFLTILGLSTSRHIFERGMRLLQDGTLEPIIGNETFRAIQWRYYLINFLFVRWFGELIGRGIAYAREESYLASNLLSDSFLSPQNSLLLWAFVLFHLIDLYDLNIQGVPKSVNNRT